MYNVRKYTLATLCGVVLAGMALSACSSDDKHARAAEDLLAKAQSLVEEHRYDSALVVLDTLDKSYRDCLDQRRQGTIVRLTALSDLTRDSLASAELQYTAARASLDSLSPQFKKVDIAGTDGYFVDKAIYTGSEMNTTAIQPRVDDQGYCFLAVNVAGKKIGLNRVSYGDAEATGTSLAVEGSEIMSITQEGAQRLIEALATCPDTKATVVLSGSKGSAKTTLDARALSALRRTWQYARALQTELRLRITLEKLERQLARLNDQIVMQTPMPVDE